MPWGKTGQSQSDKMRWMGRNFKWDAQAGQELDRAYGGEPRT